MTISKVQNSESNRQWLLASRPVGAPTLTDFNFVESDKPTAKEGEVLLRTVYLSLDPYMRGRMSDAKSYAEPVAINEVMIGGAVSRVEVSNHPDFEVGEWVVSFSGWQDYSISNGAGLLKLGKKPAKPSYALGVMGMPGLTAYKGLLDIGRPKAGETVVVAAATGAVGSIVGQIAKLQGCNVIGVAGGEKKCRSAVEELGFDACIDHKASDFVEQLAKSCDVGIDVYFENVGGKVFDAVLPLLNPCARVPVCGLISQYNATSLPEAPDRTSMLMRALLTKRIRMQGFIVFEDYGDCYDEFSQAMSQWLKEGRINYREDLVKGLESSVESFIGLLEGKNFGKLVMQVGPDEL